MAEEKEEKKEREDADAGTLLKTAIDRLDALHKRMDAMEMMDKSKKDESEEERKDKTKKDAEEEKRSKEREEKRSKEREDSTVFYKGEKAPNKFAKSDAESEEEEKEEREDAKRKDAEAKEEEERKDKMRRDAEEKEKKEREDSEEKERKDSLSAVADRIARVERMLPKALTAEERAAFSDTQARADAVFTAMGEKAPAPLTAEDLTDYKRRLAGLLKKFSPTFKEVNLYAIADDNAMKAIENTIYADAMAYASSPATAEPGQLRAIKEYRGGHEFIKYVGASSAWMNDISGPVRQYATSILTPNIGSR